MKNESLVWVVAGAGAIGLFLWYRNRQAAFARAPILAGQGTAGSIYPNPAIGASGPGALIPSGTSTHETTRLRARNEATGSLSRGQCLRPMRWIDSETGPYYGHCVTENQFQTWLRIAPSLEFVSDADIIRAGIPITTQGHGGG